MASDARFPSTCSLDVVGIGNAIVDVLVQTDDAFLGDHGLQKGGMALIDEGQAETRTRPEDPDWKPQADPWLTPWSASPSWAVAPASSVAYVMTPSEPSSAATSERSVLASTLLRPPPEPRRHAA